MLQIYLRVENINQSDILIGLNHTCIFRPLHNLHRCDAWLLQQLLTAKVVACPFHRIPCRRLVLASEKLPKCLATNINVLNNKSQRRNQP